MAMNLMASRYKSSLPKTITRGLSSPSAASGWSFSTSSSPSGLQNVSRAPPECPKTFLDKVRLRMNDVNSVINPISAILTLSGCYEIWTIELPIREVASIIKASEESVSRKMEEMKIGLEAKMEASEKKILSAIEELKNQS